MTEAEITSRVLTLARMIRRIAKRIARGQYWWTTED